MSVGIGNGYDVDRKQHQRKAGDKEPEIEFPRLEKPFPVKYDHREDGPELDVDGKGFYEIGAFDTQDRLRDDHVARRGDREKFSDPFDDGNDDCLEEGH
jgi:hypothetical protein